MTTIAIMPENLDSGETSYRAIAGTRQSIGQTAGQALDALTAQLDDTETNTLVVIQHLRPDGFFTAQQRQRLEELMNRWRAARAAQTAFLPEEQSELDALVEAEVRAAGARASVLGRHGSR